MRDKLKHLFVSFNSFQTRNINISDVLSLSVKPPQKLLG